MQFIVGFTSIALISVCFALLVLDLSLSQDLKKAAFKRLDNSTAAVERLMRLELENTQQKYANFALEPRFRAILEAQDLPTLSFYARELFVNTEAIAVVFTDTKGKKLVSAGDYLTTNANPLDGKTTLAIHDGVLITSTSVPLKIREQNVGFLLTQQVVAYQTLDEWSELLSIRLVTGSEKPLENHLLGHLDAYPMISISMSNEAETQALTNARNNVLFSFIAAMLVSILISYFFSKKMTISIQLIQRALETLGRGVFAVKLDGSRQDEIGDINRSTQQLAIRLEDWRSKLVEMDYVNSLNEDLNRKTAQLEMQKQQIESRQILLQQSMNDIQHANDQMKLYLQCLDAAQESIVIIDRVGKIKYINPFCLEYNFYARRDLFGQDYSVFIPESDREKLSNTIWGVLDVAGFWQAEAVFQKADKMSYPVDVTITRVKTQVDANESYIMVFRDISIRAEFEAQLIQVANHDELTGLLNRRCFEQQIRMAIGLHEPSSDKFAILWLDLDRFKHVNDTYGHQVGDELLIEVTTALKGVLRANDQVARMGGDEFAFLLMFVGRKTALEISHKLLECVREYRKEVEGEEITVGGSFGVAMYPDDGDSIKELLKASDIAMYQAKRRGRDQVCVYNGTSSL